MSAAMEDMCWRIQGIHCSPIACAVFFELKVNLQTMFAAWSSLHLAKGRAYNPFPHTHIMEGLTKMNLEIVIMEEVGS